MFVEVVGMIIKTETLIITISDFEAWSGAKWTIEKVCEYGKEDELFELCEQVFDGSCTATELNDFLWHEDDYIFRELGIPNDE